MSRSFETNDAETSNWSDNLESYFVIGTPAPRVAEMWASRMRSLGIGFKEVKGEYKGTGEWGFVVNLRDFDAMLPVLGGQESVLILGPKPSATDHRPATLMFLSAAVFDNTYMMSSRPPVYLGSFVPYTREEFEDRVHKPDGFTYDPSEDLFYVAEHD